MASEMRALLVCDCWTCPRKKEVRLLKPFVTHWKCGNTNRNITEAVKSMTIDERCELKVIKTIEFKKRGE